MKTLKEHGLPVDCVLRTAPLPHKTKSEIQGTTVNAPEKEIYTNYENAEAFGMAKSVLLTKVTLLMLDICRSLRDKNKMPDDLDGRMDELRQFIIEKFNRDVFVDEQAKGLVRERKRSRWHQKAQKLDTASGRNVIKNSRRGHDTAGYTLGTMGFSCVRGIQIQSFAKKRKISN